VGFMLRASGSMSWQKAITSSGQGRQC